MEGGSIESEPVCLFIILLPLFSFFFYFVALFIPQFEGDFLLEYFAVFFVCLFL